MKHGNEHRTLIALLGIGLVSSSGLLAGCGGDAASSGAASPMSGSEPVPGQAPSVTTDTGNTTADPTTSTNPGGVSPTGSSSQGTGGATSTGTAPAATAGGPTQGTAMGGAAAMGGAGGSAPGSVGAAGASSGQAEATDANTTPEPANTNVSLGGSQDIGFFRAELDAGIVPAPGDLDAAGFFAEHHTALPDPVCGERVCLQAMLGVMGNLLTGANCTMLQLGLNSPIAADPTNRPPLSLSVVVDVSGSMQDGGKIDFVRDGLELLIDELVDGDKFSLVTYSDVAQVDFPMAEIINNRTELREMVRGLSAGGGTNLYEGLQLGYREVQANYESDRQNRVILLSDGQPTAGIVDTPSIIEMSRGFNSDGVGLTSIGLGTDFNIELMRDLALQADGNFYFLEDAGAVDEVFTEELSFFTVPIAFDLKLDVQAGELYTFGRAVGSPLWEDTDNGGRLDVPSVFIAHRQSADDVTDQGGRRGGGSALLLELMPRLTEDDGSGITDADVAVIDVEFREPGTNETVQDQVVVNFPQAPWITPEEGLFVSDDVSIVQKSFVMLNIFVGMEGAIAAFHEDGDATTAIARMDRLIAAVEDYNEEVQDTDMDYDLELLNQLRSVLIANGIAEPVNPEIPENPWPAD